MRNFVLFLTALLFLGVIATTGCVDETATVRTLQSHGFSNIQVTGWAPFSCAEDDLLSTGFKATNPAGQTVEGVVCCGLVFKNCTVRF